MTFSLFLYLLESWVEKSPCISPTWATLERGQTKSLRFPSRKGRICSTQSRPTWSNPKASIANNSIAQKDNVVASLILVTIINLMPLLFRCFLLIKIPQVLLWFWSFRILGWGALELYRRPVLQLQGCLWLQSTGRLWSPVSLPPKSHRTMLSFWSDTERRPERPGTKPAWASGVTCGALWLHLACRWKVRFASEWEEAVRHIWRIWGAPCCPRR